MKPESKLVGTCSVLFGAGLLTFLLNRFVFQFFPFSQAQCSDFLVPMPIPPQHWEPIGLFFKSISSNFISALKDVEASTGLKVKCSVADAFIWFAEDIAEEIKVPWVAVWSGPRSLLLHVETDFIRRRVGTIAGTYT